MIIWTTDTRKHPDASFVEDAVIGTQTKGYVAQLLDGTWLGKPGVLEEKIFASQEEARLWVSSLIALEE